MGVYIKGMNIPKVCAECPFWETRYDPGYYQYDHCKALGRYFARFDIDSFREKFDNCPIQPIDDEMVEKTQRELFKAWSVFQSVFKDEKL